MSSIFSLSEKFSEKGDRTLTIDRFEFLLDLIGYRKNHKFVRAVNHVFLRMEKQISSLIVRKHSIEYENAFESEMLESKLQFVYKILRKIEDNRESICNILKEDSNLTNKRFEYGSGSEKRELECLNLLKNVINNRGKNDIPKKELGKAYAFLGIAHEIGAFNLKVDFGKAHYNYILALRNGSGMGAFRLAVMYEKGTYEKKNFAKALLYYECAAKMGLAEGAHAYGMILYYTEDDKIHDYQTGFDFIKFAMVNATPEYPYPFFDLARIYEHGNSQISIPKDLKYSFKIYVHGASIGCPNCCYRLGRSFEYGELNRQRSWKDAIYWYKKAASYGQVDAQMALSTFYLTGIDRVLDINYEEAYKWTLKAAITGHAGAAYSLGGYIEQGIGIKKDSAHALWWYSISGLYGNKNAKYKIEQLSYKISKTPTKSKRWWQFCC